MCDRLKRTAIPHAAVFGGEGDAPCAHPPNLGVAPSLRCKRSRAIDVPLLLML